MTRDETAKEHLRNALALVGALRQEVAILQNAVHGMTGATMNAPAIANCFEAVSRRIWQALEQIEGDHTEVERARMTGAV